MGCEESFIAEIDAQNALKSRRQVSSIKRTYHRKGKLNINCSLNQTDFSITDEDVDMIEALLLSHPLFYKIKNLSSTNIIAKLQKFKAQTNQIIFRKNEIPNYFYIILEGTIQITDFAEKMEDKILYRGQCFGDIGIYNKSLRSGTAVCLTSSKLLGLRKDHFLKIAVELSKKSQRQIFKQIKDMSIFSFLNIHQKHKISYLAQELKYPKGAYIFRKGENSDCLFIVRSGKVKLQISDKQNIEVYPKQSFGQSCLKKQKSFRFGDAICMEETVLLSFNRSDMIKYLGNSLIDIQISNKVFWALRHQQLLKASSIIHDTMIELKQIKFACDNDLISKKGEEIKYFIISLEGKINNYQQLQVVNISYLHGFKYQAENLVKIGDGLVAFILIEQIQQKFNRRIDQLLQLNHNICKDAQNYEIIKSYASLLELESFIIMKVKGLNQHGMTLKVRSDSKMQFALKVVQKYKVIHDNAQENIVMLKNINQKISHHLIAKTYRIYSDSYRIYLLNKYIPGQDLFDYLATQIKLNKNIARHFIACIINILQYLHRHKILWRQMKIQSFVIDQEGYLNLVDLMYLEQLPEDQFYLDAPSKATIHYLPPETLSGQGYGFQSDIWVLGVIIYKMLVGKFPFGNEIKTSDPDILDQLAQQINNNDLNLPNQLPPDAKALLKLLLNVSPLERSLISISKIKSMAFFNDYDWLGLMEKRIKNIGYIPKCKKRQDKDLELVFCEWEKKQQKIIITNQNLDRICEI